MAERVQLSIHPRNWPSSHRPGYDKSNTAGRHKGGGKLAKKMAHLSTRRTAHSALLKSLPSSVNPAAFKTPGSMNEHK